MKIEEIFGANAGKVWGVLKKKGALGPSAIAKEAKIKMNDVYGGLGWLSKEGKIQIIEGKKGVLFKLNE